MPAHCALAGTALAFIHGLFLGQLTLLPLLAASYRLLGNPFAPAAQQVAQQALLDIENIGRALGQANTPAHRVPYETAREDDALDL